MVYLLGIVVGGFLLTAWVLGMIEIIADERKKK
jgi:hypothetical protein